MANCPECSAQVTDGVPFCDTCGTALSWQGDPDFQPFRAAGPAAPAPRAPLEQAPGAVVGTVAGGRDTQPPVAPAPLHAAASRFGVTLELPASEVPVEPGGTAVLEARVRNRGDVVDEFALWVEGPPAPWVRVEPPRLPVYPGQDATARLTFTPPRDGVAAGREPFRLVAQSVQQGGAGAVQDGGVDVAAVTRLALDVVPERQRTEALAEYQVVLQNRGNHDVVVDLEARDPQYLLQVQVDPPRLYAPAFGSATATMHALAPGAAPDQPRPFPLTVTATPADRPQEAPVTADAVLVHHFAPPAAYLATLLGWLIGGLLAGLVLGGAWLLLEWVLRIEVGRFGVELPVGVVIAGVTVASALLARRAILMRRALRARATALLLLVLTPLWAVGLVLAVVAVLDRGSPGLLAGVAVLFAVVDPALVGRWLALRGMQEPLLPKPAARRPASPPPVPGPGPGSTWAARPGGPPASAPQSPGVPVRAGARSHRSRHGCVTLASPRSAGGDAAQRRVE